MPTREIVSTTETTAGSLKPRKPRKPRAPKPDLPSAPTATSKTAVLVAIISRRQGATLAELIAATGWQAHSVRGAISGSLKKKLALPVITELVAGRGRIYRLEM